MWPIALAFALAAAAPPAPAAPAPADTAGSAYRSEPALRHYLQGRWLEESERPQDAQAELSRALSLDPAATDVMLHLCELAANSGDAGRSLELADRVLERDPGNARALWLRARRCSASRARPRRIAPLEARAADSHERGLRCARSRTSPSRWTGCRAGADSATTARRASTTTTPRAGSSSPSTRARLGRFARRRQRARPLGRGQPGAPGSRCSCAAGSASGWAAPREAIGLYRHHLEVHADDQATRRRLVALLAQAGKRNAEALAQAQLRRRGAARRPVRAAASLADLEFARRQRAAGGAHAHADARALAPRRSRARRAQRRGAAAQRAARATRCGSRRVGRAHAGDPRSGPLRCAAGCASRAAARTPPLAYARLEVACDARLARGRGGVLARYLREARALARGGRPSWRAAAPARARRPARCCSTSASAASRPGDVARRHRTRAATRWRWRPTSRGRSTSSATCSPTTAGTCPRRERLIRRAVEQDPDNGAYLDSMGWVLYRLGRLPEARTQLEQRRRPDRGGPGGPRAPRRRLPRAQAARPGPRRSTGSASPADSRNTRVRNKLEPLH